MKVHTDNLNAALKVVSTTVSTQGDIGSHFLFTQKEDGWASIHSTNTQCYTSVPIPLVSGDVSAPFTVEAKRLQKVLGTIGDGVIDVDLCSGEDAGEVRVTSLRGELFLSSLDPKDFPQWGDGLKDAKPSGTVNAKALHSAISYSRMFLSDKEGTGFTAMDTDKGAILATDRIAVSFSKVTGLEHVSLKLQTKSAPAVVAFLTSCGEDDVSIRETDRLVFFVRKDNAVLGVTKYQVQYPPIEPNWGENAKPEETWQMWQVPRKDLMDQIKFLASGASDSDLTLRLNLTADEKYLQMRMKSSSGRKDISVTAPLQGVTSGGPGSVSLPDSGVPLSHPHLVKALNNCGDIVNLVVVQKAKGGWVRIQSDVDNNKYLTLISWVQPQTA